MLFIHKCNCKHLDVLIVHLFTVIEHINLRSASFDINSFPASPLVVANSWKTLEMCIHNPQIWHGTQHIAAHVSLLKKSEDEREKYFAFGTESKHP